ncbi:hypothetical protein ET532_003715 [Verminephrobacter sp. Larva24]|nr:hypothetical protein ET532_003715 [Verminephrobacter sp. Larva24]
MLIDFFYTLRSAKLPVSVKEYLTLLQALQAGVVGPRSDDAWSLDDFYSLARLTLVKDERHYDRFDRAFGAYFKGVELVADFSRKGFVQGRSVRLMTVSVRPGRPNGAASGFLSGMLREPLAGERARCPVAPETPVALASPGNTVAGIIRAASASAAEWRVRTAVNLPALTTTVREMAQALEHVAGRAASALIDWEPDAQIAKIVTSWPSRIHAARAQSLGLSADPSFDAILRSYLRENPQAHQWPRQ